MSRGHCILSHGFESGPDAIKVTALAEVAERLGWTHERPDYTDLDAQREVSSLGDVRARLQGTEVPGAHGIFNMSANDHLGLDQRAYVMVKIDNGTWKYQP